MPRRGFTLIELLVVVAIIAVLIAIAIPAFAHVRRKAVKTTCAANLRSIGTAIEVYRSDHRDKFPAARGMPDPFFTADTDPPLPEVLKPFVAGWPNGGTAQRVYRCNGDDVVYPRARTSYQYHAFLSGFRLDDLSFIPVGPSQIWVSRDFDGGTFDLQDGSSLTAPFFHDLRNFLFADNHVGNFDLQ